MLVGVVLQAEEAFRGVVGLHVAHLGRVDQALVKVAVRLEADAAMKEDLQVGPYLRQVCLAGLGEDRLEKDKHPGGNAGKVADVFVPGIFNNCLDLALPFVHQDNLFLRDPDHAAQSRDVLDQDRREVALVGPLVERREAVAPTEDQPFPREEAAVGPVAQVDGHRVVAAPVMAPVQDLVGDGQELALVAGGPAAFGVPLDGRGPKDVPLALDHPVDVGLQVVVGLYGDPLPVVGVRADALVVVCLAPKGALGLVEEHPQLFVLYLVRLVAETLDFFQPFPQDKGNRTCQYVHGRSFCLF